MSFDTKRVNIQNPWSNSASTSASQNEYILTDWFGAVLKQEESSDIDSSYSPSPSPSYSPSYSLESISSALDALLEVQTDEIDEENPTDSEISTNPFSNVAKEIKNIVQNNVPDLNKPIFLVVGGPSCSGKSTFLNAVNSEDNIVPGAGLLNGRQCIGMDHNNKLPKLFKNWLEENHPVNNKNTPNEILEFLELNGLEVEFRQSDEFKDWKSKFESIPNNSMKASELAADLKAKKQYWMLNKNLDGNDSLILDSRATNYCGISSMIKLAKEKNYFVLMLSVAVSDSNTYLKRWKERDKIKKKGESDFFRIRDDSINFLNNWEKFTIECDASILIDNSENIPEIVFTRSNSLSNKDNACIVSTTSKYSNFYSEERIKKLKSVHPKDN